jgi:protein-S-isoprenylcysteine O-methyltransferase Ste14
MIPANFWIVLLACGLYGALHSVLAAQGVKAWAGRIFATRYYRLAYNIVAGVTLLPLMALVLGLPDTKLYSIPMPWLAGTLLVQAVAALGLMRALMQPGSGDFMGFSQAQGHPVPAEHLETGGLYAWVRHPIYAFGLLLMWLLPVMSWNMLALIFGLTVYIFVGATLEERKLLAVYGDQYAAYRRRTPMLLPRFWRRPA